MATTNLDAANLAAALSGGVIREDVIDHIYNLDEGIPTPFTDLAKRDTFKNVYSEWTENDLNAVDLDNAVIDGADAAGNDTKVGKRVGNRAQISDKVVQISTVAEEVDSIGGQGRMAYQTAKRLMDLRRDVEAIALSNQGSVADNGNNTPGRTAGFSAWLVTNTDVGSGGDDGGFQTDDNLVDAPTPGEARALTWGMVQDVLEGIYTAGGQPSVVMSVPGVIKRINAFLLSANGAPYRANPVANVEGTGPGAKQTAQGWINVVLSDFGISMEFIPNRLQQVYESGDSDPDNVADVFLIDPAHVGIGYLYGYRVDDLAKQGHSDRKLISTTWMTKVYREDAHGVVRDVDPTLAVTASAE